MLTQKIPKKEIQDKSNFCLLQHRYLLKIKLLWLNGSSQTTDEELEQASKGQKGTSTHPVLLFHFRSFPNTDLDTRKVSQT